MKKFDPLIFIVEDDIAFSSLIKSYLRAHGSRNIKVFHSGEDCLKELHLKPKIVIQDFDLPGMNGLEVLKKVKSLEKDTEFIFLSGQHSLKIAIDIMKNGAFDYVIKDEVAKDYILNKVNRLKHILKLEYNQRINKVVKRLFIFTLLITWFLFGFFYLHWGV